MFERTLQDLIRGLRAHKASSKAQEEAFLAEAMVEIRDELRGKDMALKAEGVLKMCYLMMLYPLPPPPGFAFHVVEVMSSPRYHLKQLGYMAAPMAFSGETEEVVLTVNGIKKDLMSPHLSLPPLPLTALPHLLSLSPSLSHTLHPDLLHLLTHSSPRIRKHAVLCLLPCWEAFPEGLREGFPRLRDKLLDEDQGVVGATVGVVMELARRQGGKNYLPLAPELFGILTGSSNNWMLIKVVKLFAILTPLEPRLVRKLLPVITNLISSTSAISLLYECVRTCIVGGMLDPDRPEGEALARVCVEKLGGYLRDEGGDQNLRYIALLAMVKIIPTHPHMVAEYQEEIMESLDDPDVSIRMRALELVTSMVDRNNLQSIVDQLLAHLSPAETPSLPSAMASLQAAAAGDSPSSTSAAVSLSPAYRLLLAQRLLGIIAQDTYTNVTDFQWVVSVLVDVAYVSRVDVGAEIRDMLLDVVGRVKSVRTYAVGVLEKVVGDDAFRERGRDGTGEEAIVEAATWICGEYSTYLSSPLSAISDILTPTLSACSPSLISISLQATAKIFGSHCADVSSRWNSDTHEQTKALVTSLQSGYSTFLSHPEIEVQERAVEFSQLLAFMDADLASHIPPKPKLNGDLPGMEGGFEDPNDSDNPPYPKSLFLFQPLFTSHELNAVALHAQGAVRVPEGLDLERDIVPAGGFVDSDLPELESEEDEEEAIELGAGGGAGMEELRKVLREQEGKKKKGKGKKKDGELTAEEKADKERRKAERRARQKDNPYYLGEKEEEVDVDVDDIPIVRLDDEELVAAEESVEADSKKSKTRSSKSRSKAQKPPPTPPPDFDRTGELPEGASDTPAPPSRPLAADRSTSGLAGVDLLSPSPLARGSTSMYEEYTAGDADEKSEMENGNGNGNGTTELSVGEKQAEVEAAKEVEVVKVKRKKKKKQAE